ncbi:MAG: beta-lactamase family protein, partial [Oscillospiraceae bacterium]|nr:beta-lactamase family protein [Oscillospiraceae bacterium]
DHTSGIMGSVNKNDDLYDDNEMSNYESLLETLSVQRLKAAPGEYSAYCNSGFDLLQMIVENVSGMPYTDYVRKNISDKIGADCTGTPLDMFGRDDLAPIYCFGNIPHDYEYCMSLGSGGIYATASDTAEFGGTFFTGDNTLLSENAKNDMATRWNGADADGYTDGNGLGWDYVEKLHYEQSGIRVMGKGGDIGTMHAHLLVAPDEEISIAVLSAGGGSNYNELMADALLDVVLDERGKAVDKTLPDIQLADSIPDEYRKYEGFYTLTTASSGGIIKIYFDADTMYSEAVCTGNSTRTRYKPTDDGGFAKVDEKGNISPERMLIHFAEKNGKVYLKGDMIMTVPGLGESSYSTYSGENIDDNPVTDDVRSAWKNRSGRAFAAYGDKYSCAVYDDPFFRMVTDEALDGYVVDSMGNPYRVNGENELRFFTTAPSSTNRDLMDIDVHDVTFADGTSGESLDVSDGRKYRYADEIPELTKDITEITLNSDEARWFRIGADMGGGSITAERPENSVICVYNRFFELVYTTHMKDAPSEIPLPADGYILFHGETGGIVKI